MKTAENKGITLDFTQTAIVPPGTVDRLGQGCLSLLLFWGLGATLYSMFGMSASVPLLLFAGIAVIGCSYVFLLFPRYRMIALLLPVLLFLLLLFLTGFAFKSGAAIAANAISDVFGRHAGRIFPFYEIGIAEDRYALSLTLFLFPIAAVLAVLSVYLVRANDWVLTLFALLACIVVQLLWGIAPTWPWYIFLFLSFAVMLIWRCMRRRQRESGAEGRVIAVVAAVLLLLSGAVLTVLLLLWPVGSFTKLGLAAAAERQVASFIEDIRYEKASANTLPEGDFTGLTGLHLTEDAALQVTMSKPASLYLRGYVGSVYTAKGWRDLAPDALYEQADLFYWLHDEFHFYGQTQLSNLAMVVDETAQNEEPLTIAVENVGGNSKYIYAPYEIYQNDLLDANGIGDISIQAGGWNGLRNYTYSSLSNQVKRYPQLAMSLYDKEEAGDPAAHAYHIYESHYNDFVYKSFTDIPAEDYDLLHNHFGEIDWGGEPHLGYTEAKQRILNYFNSNIKYNETISPLPKGADFLGYFLEQNCEGYSVHYATAAALMFRYMGIPARYVEGYIITPEDASSAKADEPINVNGKHAHAWVEYYQDGVGWIPFEVTPPYLFLMEQAEDLQVTKPLQTEPQNHQEDNTNRDGDNDEQPPTIGLDKVKQSLLKVAVVVAIVFFLLLLTLVLFLIVRRRRVLARRVKALAAADTSRSIQLLFGHVMQLLWQRGLPRRKGSLRQYKPLLKDLCGEEMARRFAEIADIHQEARFSTHEMTAKQTELLRRFRADMVKDLRSSSGLWQRLLQKYIDVLY